MRDINLGCRHKSFSGLNYSKFCIFYIYDNHNRLSFKSASSILNSKDGKTGLKILVSLEAQSYSQSSLQLHIERNYVSCKEKINPLSLVLNETSPVCCKHLRKIIVCRERNKNQSVVIWLLHVSRFYMPAPCMSSDWFVS